MSLLEALRPTLFRASLRNRVGHFFIAVTVAAGPALGSAQQARDAATVNASLLQNHYSAADSLRQAGRIDEAAHQYRLFLADALGELAIGYGRAGDYSKAAPLFDDALALAPRSPALQVEYAQAALAGGDTAHADRVAQQIIAAYPDNPNALARAHFIRGRIAFQQNRTPEARTELAAAWALNPTFANGYALAVACLEMFDKNAADRVFAKLTQRGGDTASVHMDIGRAYGESNFEPSAVAEFRKAIAEDPKFPGAHYSVAAALIGAGGESKWPEAESELKLELARSPQYALAWTALGHLAALEGHNAEARQDLERAAKLDPSNPDTFLYLGELDVAENNSAAAESALRSSIRLTRDESRNQYAVRQAHFLLARLLQRSGRTQESRAELRKVQQIAQAELHADRQRMSAILDPPTGVGSGASTDDSENPGPAARVDVAAAQQAAALRQRLSPALADAYNNLGVIAASQKDYTTALENFEHAAMWNSAMPGLDENWGRAAFFAGRFSDAIGPLQRLLRIRPDDPHLRTALGISLYETGDYAACVRLLQPRLRQLKSIPDAERVYSAALSRLDATR